MIFYIFTFLFLKIQAFRIPVLIPNVSIKFFKEKLREVPNFRSIFTTTDASVSIYDSFDLTPYDKANDLTRVTIKIYFRNIGCLMHTMI